jgi:hypothetical protein
MSSDRDVLQHISELVKEEHELRNGIASDAAHSDQARGRLADLEVALDQCWDLLRRRQALRDTGQDPDTASVQPPETVERYLG